MKQFFDYSTSSSKNDMVKRGRLRNEEHKLVNSYTEYVDLLNENILWDTRDSQKKKRD